MVGTHKAHKAGGSSQQEPLIKPALHESVHLELQLKV